MLANGKLVCYREGKIVIFRDVSSNFSKLIDSNLSSEVGKKNISKKNLNEKDVLAYNELVKKADIIPENSWYSAKRQMSINPSKFLHSEEALFERLKILIGSYEAGNNKNKLLRNELMLIIDKLLALEKLSKEQHKEIYERYIK